MRAMIPSYCWATIVQAAGRPEQQMRAKSGMHPYDAGVFFILREKAGGGWPPRDIGKVSGWFATRLLAAQYGKTPREVARDIIDRALALEDGYRQP